VAHSCHQLACGSPPWSRQRRAEVRRSWNRTCGQPGGSARLGPVGGEVPARQRRAIGPAEHPVIGTRSTHRRRCSSRSGSRCGGRCTARRPASLLGGPSRNPSLDSVSCWVTVMRPVVRSMLSRRSATSSPQRQPRPRGEQHEHPPARCDGLRERDGCSSVGGTRSGVRSAPAPRITHGLRRISSSTSAVLRIDLKAAVGLRGRRSPQPGTQPLGVPGAHDAW